MRRLLIHLGRLVTLEYFGSALVDLFGVRPFQIIQDKARIENAAAVLKQQHRSLGQWIVLSSFSALVPRHFGQQFKRQDFFEIRLIVLGAASNCETPRNTCANDPCHW